MKAIDVLPILKEKVAFLSGQLQIVRIFNKLLTLYSFNYFHHQWRSILIVHHHSMITRFTSAPIMSMGVGFVIQAERGKKGWSEETIAWPEVKSANFQKK